MAGPSAALRLDGPAATPTGIPAGPASAAGDLRRDLRLIAEMIEPGSRVLDIGCGDGACWLFWRVRRGSTRAASS